MVTTATIYIHIGGVNGPLTVHFFHSLKVISWQTIDFLYIEILYLNINLWILNLNLELYFFNLLPYDSYVFTLKNRWWCLRRPCRCLRGKFKNDRLLHSVDLFVICFKITIIKQWFVYKCNTFSLIFKETRAVILFFTLKTSAANSFSLFSSAFGIIAWFHQQFRVYRVVFKVKEEIWISAF